MLILQTIIVYTLLFCLMLFFSVFVAKTKKTKYIYYSCLLYAVVFGLRYGVGADFFGYLKAYEYYKLYGYFFRQMEIGFLYLIQFVSSLQLDSSWFFGIVAFIQVALLHYALKDNKPIYPFLTISFFLGCTWLMFCNELRQTISLCILYVAINYIIQSKFWKFYILAAVACMFHSSAIILFLFYPLLHWKSDWTPKVRTQLIYLCIALVVMYSNYAQNFIEQMNGIVEYVGYGHYVKNLSSDIYNSAKVGSIGVGFYITLFINITLICCSEKVKRWSKDQYFISIYNLFFIGCLFKYAFLNSLLVMRLSYYFIGFDFIVGAYTLYYLYQKRRNVFIYLLGLYCLTFCGVLYMMKENTSLYIFSFQEELFDIKKK